MQVPFVDLGAQYAAIGREVDAAMGAVLQRGDFILGRDLERFEEEFAAYCEAPFAVGVDSGMSALTLILRGYGIGPGDEVITSANTFIATALTISMVGARPVLVDIDPETLTLDLERLERAITPRTRAIMPVHLYGHPEDMDPINELAARHGLIVIEDACQAHGARYKGKRTGALGHAAAYSFYPAKNLGAYGDGGMVVTADPELVARLQLLRNYGQSEKYHHEIQGYNHRLDTLQAAALRIKLRYLDDWNAARRQHAARYSRLLAGSGVMLPPVMPEVEPVWHLYIIRTRARDALRAYLGERGIATGIHYPIPIHLQPAYTELGYREGDFPISEAAAQEMLSLPMYAELQAEQIDYVAEAVRAFMAERGAACAIAAN
ncbi:MAG TPA: DegT/DnrJ/EryC1/StrS family aminotransferase [Thermomicrobiaceae bacterium]|nr:DegT/DnrJ/EryC1/StrS family aminotransferase [Thermomicrobiaceae bacterium]